MATPFAILAAYDLAVFQPRYPAIRHLIETAAPDERTPSPQVSRAIHALPSLNLSAYVSRLLLQKFDFPKSESPIRWHLSGALWWALVALHLSENEQLTLLLSLSYMGNSTSGFSAAAQAIFHAPLNSLTLEQAAKLAVISKAPSAYLESPERLARVHAALMSRLQNGL